jgi:hypothetical protein
MRGRGRSMPEFDFTEVPGALYFAAAGRYPSLVSESPAPRPAFFQPASGAVILGVDWLCFGLEWQLGPVSMVVMSLAAVAASYAAVGRIQAPLEAPPAPLPCNGGIRHGRAGLSAQQESNRSAEAVFSRAKVGPETGPGPDIMRACRPRS